MVFTSEYKECPNCGGIIEHDADDCLLCGATVNEVSLFTHKHLVVVAVLVVILLSALYIAGLKGDGATVQDITAMNGEVRVPIVNISSDVSYFRINIDNVTIRFFSVLGSDTEVHTAFDACDVCYTARAGYHQRDENMLCGNCGNRYPINGIGTENLGGGCWPGFLWVTSDGDSIIVQVDDLRKGIYYFE